MTLNFLEKILVLLEEKVEEHEDEEGSYHEGFNDACRWIQIMLEDMSLEDQDCEDDEDEQEW